MSKSKSKPKKSEATSKPEVNAGDGHIWTGTMPEGTPLAACGYSPPLVGVFTDPEDGEPDLIQHEIVHAEPTGKPCAACVEVATPELPAHPEPVADDTDAED